MTQGYFWTMAKILITVVFITVLISFVWENYKSSKDCETEINTTARIAKNLIMECVRKCWSRHGFGNDKFADDCYVVNVFLQDRNISSHELENEFTLAFFDEIVKGKETKLKIRYDPSVPRIGLYVIK